MPTRTRSPWRWATRATGRSCSCLEESSSHGSSMDSRRRPRTPASHRVEIVQMGARDDIARLVKEATASMKTDAKGAVAKLEAAYVLVVATGDADDTATVAEELARGWARRKSAAR